VPQHDRDGRQRLSLETTTLIATPTVFVLGAGASAPYGFPLGADLAETICRHVGNRNSVLLRQLRSIDFPESLIQSFGRELGESGRSSIDAFLEKRSEYREVGRACIAAILLPFELDDELDTIKNPTSWQSVQGSPMEARRAQRWYHYLFDHMLTGGEFEQNQLSVVTFNFDRSFERAMYRAVRANYGGSNEDITKRCDSLPVVHLHGLLGEPDWWHMCAASARPFDGKNVTPDAVRGCAEQIKLYVDGSFEGDVTRAQALLRHAQRICFLGFSYHPSNVAKLGIRPLLAPEDPTKSPPSVEGTAYRMSTGARYSATALFEGRIRLHESWDVLKFLEETTVVHEMMSRSRA
jgi:hypothetical protein